MAKNDEKAITKLMEVLDISREEAIETLAFDKGEIEVAEVAEIEGKLAEVVEKPKTAKKGGSPLDKVKNARAKKKVDAQKENFVTLLKNFLHSETAFHNVQEMTSSKFTFKDELGNYYSLSLTKHKAKPDGYHEEEGE